MYVCREKGLMHWCNNIKNNNNAYEDEGMKKGWKN